MAWQDRLRTPSLTSPSGIVMTFLYENVSTSFTPHATVFEFPDVDGSYVQVLGRSGRRMPLRLIISGEDYDQEARKLMAMLLETGISVLVHPLYGTFNVVPVGDIARRDDLKTGGNQAVFDVEFFETNKLLFPTNTNSPGDVVLSAINGFNIAGPDELLEVLDLDTVLEEASLKDRYEALLSRAKVALSAVAAVKDDVESTFEAVFDSINLGIDTLIRDPLTLANQTQVLMQLPARSGALISDRLDAYGNLLETIVGNATLGNPTAAEGGTGVPGTVYTQTNDAQGANAFRNDYLFAANALIGAITSTVDNTFEIRSEAVSAANSIMEMCDRLNFWKDLNLQDPSASLETPPVGLGVIDEGGTYQQVQNACAQAAGFLVFISFSVKQERSITLDVPRSPLDLESELYGTAGENLDFLINSNDLQGDEIFHLPAGRTIVYYV